jgi:hypothetical protein
MTNTGKYQRSGRIGYPNPTRQKKKEVENYNTARKFTSGINCD